MAGSCWASATASRFWWRADCSPAPWCAIAALKFICRTIPLRIETTNSPFTARGEKGQVLRLPIAHGEGCYIADDRTLDQLEAEDRVLFRYAG